MCFAHVKSRQQHVALWQHQIVTMCIPADVPGISPLSAALQCEHACRTLQRADNTVLGSSQHPEKSRCKDPTSAAAFTFILAALQVATSYIVLHGSRTSTGRTLYCRGSYQLPLPKVSLCSCCVQRCRSPNFFLAVPKVPRCWFTPFAWSLGLLH